MLGSDVLRLKTLVMWILPIPEVNSAVRDRFQTDLPERQKVASLLCTLFHFAQATIFF